MVAGVSVGVVILIIAITVVAVCIIVIAVGMSKSKKNYQFSNRMAAKYPSSPSYDDNGSIAETPDLGETDTPELAKRQSGVELQPLDDHKSGSSSIPSGPIPVDRFIAHVEKFDANRQLLFQKEFDVSM